jgi:hypothetical protein
LRLALFRHIYQEIFLFLSNPLQDQRIMLAAPWKNAPHARAPRVPQADIQDGQGSGHVAFDALPDLRLASCAGMVLFHPRRHLCGRDAGMAAGPEVPAAGEMVPSLPSPAVGAVRAFGPIRTDGLGTIGALPPLPLLQAAKDHPDTVFIPREEDCFALWDRYRMPEHIRRHCRSVADLAAGIARRAGSRGAEVDPRAVYAVGLLHDLAKGYCIVHGGNHAQMGAAWVMRETGNGLLAQGVLFHVHWPWKEELTDNTLLVMALIYADKRVLHDAYVSLEDRFGDLLSRYGVTDAARVHITSAYEQGKRIEAALSDRLGVRLHEYTAHRGRLVR